MEAGHSRAREVAVCVGEGGNGEGKRERGGREGERREGGRGRERDEYLWIYFLIL